MGGLCLRVGLRGVVGGVVSGSISFDYLNKFISGLYWEGLDSCPDDVSVSVPVVQTDYRGGVATQFFVYYRGGASKAVDGGTSFLHWGDEAFVFFPTGSVRIRNMIRGSS